MMRDSEVILNQILTLCRSILNLDERYDDSEIELAARILEIATGEKIDTDDLPIDKKKKGQ